MLSDYYDIVLSFIYCFICIW